MEWDGQDTGGLARRDEIQDLLGEAGIEAPDAFGRALRQVSKAKGATGYGVGHGVLSPHASIPQKPWQWRGQEGSHETQHFL